MRRKAKGDCTVEVEDAADDDPCAGAQHSRRDDNGEGLDRADVSIQNPGVD